MVKTVHVEMDHCQFMAGCHKGGKSPKHASKGHAKGARANMGAADFEASSCKAEQPDEHAVLGMRCDRL